MNYKLSFETLIFYYLIPKSFYLISLVSMQTHDDSFEPQGPVEFKEVTEVLGKDAKKLHRMGILTGRRL